MENISPPPDTNTQQPQRLMFEQTEQHPWLPDNVDFDAWSFSDLPGDTYAVPFLDFSYLPPDHHYSPQPPQKRRRGRPYTGCLTCRDRKIKCDGGRPVCSNCEKSRHYACRGYLDFDAAKSKARIATHDVHTTALSDAPDTALAQSPIPFQQQFHAGTRSPGEKYAVHQSKVRSPLHVGGRSQSTPSNVTATEDGQPTSWEDLIPRSEIQSERLDNDGVPSHTALTLVDNQLDNQNEQATVGSDYKDYDLLLHYKKVVCHIMMPTIDIVRNPWLQIYLPMAMRDPPTASQLALRYALMSVAAYNLAQADDPRAHKDDQRAVHYRSKAAEILKDLVHSCMEEKDTSDRCASLAAAMSLISTDVFGDDGFDCNVNVNMAKRIVQKTGGERFWTSTHETSVLYQIFRCYDMVASTTRSGPNDPSSQNSSQKSTGSVASDQSESPSDESANEGLLDTATLREDVFPYQGHYILDTTFGIGLRTMSLLHRTIRLSMLCAQHKARSSRWPDDLSQDVGALRNQLHRIAENPASFIPSVSGHQMVPRLDSRECRATVASLGSSTQPRSLFPGVICDELMENHQWAFHYAVIVYYYRVFSTLSAALQQQQQQHNIIEADNSDANCQRYVDKILERLENIDCLTRGTDVRPANTLWPAFVAAAEAVNVDLRHRALLWFSRAARQGIGNIPRAKHLTMEIWRRVDRQLPPDEPSSSFSSNQGLGPVDWREVMEELGSLIMLT
ncbi:uncharacterized protein PV06_07815 [Exophiala oligosperma]|uniref:Zn(2)-C6 fungal-type domain-containing protein n=1 Tax=Exophiala oligosperma TaxID=215243 RepID=A0A0D2DYM1_9EURO|nr:uncharacterized protein PV06_07815 [Exophiala oligosperma]KIW40634.1 hypothetical protein PV06_07815 [Exophiala oligosperma]